MRNFHSVDTFPTYRQLVETGFNAKQAEVLIETFRNLNKEFAESLITKDLFEEKTNEVKSEINDVKGEIELVKKEIEIIKYKIEFMEKGLRQEMEIIKKDLITKLGAIIVASMAFFSVAVPLIQKLL